MTEEVKIAIREAFNAGIAANLTEDQIKINMIQAGSTFKSVAKEYAEFLVDAGLVASKEDKEKVIASVMEAFDVSTEDGFNGAVESIVSQLKGVDEKSAAGSIRYACRKAEKPCYVKAKAESTGKVGFKRQFYDMLIENPNMTKEEAEEILNADGVSENVRKHASAYHAVRKLANAIASGNPSDESDDSDDGDDE